MSHEGQTWFFKASGLADAVGAHVGEFDQWLDSVVMEEAPRS
jgi:hypothetical protein